MKNWKTNNPKEKGEYLCRMDNAYIKMCHWDGGDWLDMWIDSLKGTVKEWACIPIEEWEMTEKEDITFSEALAKVQECLKDPDFRYSWVSNIAMAQIDCTRWYRERNDKKGKYLNYKDRHAIANEGAEYFIKILSE